MPADRFSEPARTFGCVIVSYRSNAVLPGLLRSLSRHEPQAPVVVVDNASPVSPEVREEAIELHIMATNRGYGAACNVGFRLLTTQYPHLDAVAFLNPDLRLQAPSLSQLAAALSRLPPAGITTGLLCDRHGNRLASAWGRLSSARAFWYATGWSARGIRAIAGRLAVGGLLTSAASMTRDELPVDGHVLGGAMLVRRRCFEQLGGFDERYFVYGEDADLCIRARQRGWQVWLLPCEPMIHLEGASSAEVDAENRWRLKSAGMQHFARTHLSPRHARRISMALKLGRFLSRESKLP